MRSLVGGVFCTVHWIRNSLWCFTLVNCIVSVWVLLIALTACVVGLSVRCDVPLDRGRGCFGAPLAAGAEVSMVAWAAVSQVGEIAGAG